MNKAYQPLILILLAVGLLVGYSLFRGWTTPPEVVPWKTDYAAARTEAATSHKPLLLYFTATWCGPCQQMKRSTFADGRVADALRDFVAVKIDVDQSRDLATQFAVDGIPRLQLIRADGEPGRSHVGYISADELIQWLRAG